jgi:glycosyltransferase involved in cell wall biosynthesis
VTWRVTADGKHLSLGGSPFRIRGVTYGSFVPRLDGEPYPDPSQIKLDLTAMAAAGLNTVRTYTLPPPELLDLADELDLKVLVGLHYQDWRQELQPGRAARRRILRAGCEAVERAMERCAGHRSVLALSVGNEVPADVVRVHGIGSVEETLAALVGRVHAADEAMLATYCNYPSTEYLEVDGADLTCFNVFLERPEALRRYLRHLQIVAHEMPLVITELGLASQVHGEAAQAEAMAWQLRAVDEAGCAGATVFAWTDEWGVAGEAVEGWGFGVTAADRSPKAALEAVSSWARSPLVEVRKRWPSMSVVVCAYNEERTIGECLASLQACDYPGLEVIVCDDGSTDATLDRARTFGFRVLRLPHRGLSAARNAGLAAASGEIVAYLDADAACHRDWPYYLALSLEDDNVMATGGPNLAFPEAERVERAVAASPGSPMHVLVSDDRAEHVPGCNMAFRKRALQEIGGFDEVYTSAGDDVDVCWKLTDRGYDIAFAAAAQVRHHRRGTVKGYLRQQRGYGRAERMLSGPHRHRFNRLGQARWRGCIYMKHASLSTLLRPVVYHGWLGSAPFQPVTGRPNQALLDWASAMAPLVAAAMVVAVAAGVVFAPFWALAAGLAGLLVLYATAAGWAAPLDRREPHPAKVRALIGALHLMQPLARMWGRLRGSPARSASPGPPAWTGERLAWLESFEHQCSALRCTVRPGGPVDPWDLEISRGPLLRCRFSAAVVWQWTPLHRARLAPRPAAVAAFALAAMGAWVGPPILLALPCAIAAAAVTEATVLRSSVRRAVQASAPPMAAAADEPLQTAGRS